MQDIMQIHTTRSICWKRPRIAKPKKAASRQQAMHARTTHSARLRLVTHVCKLQVWIWMMMEFDLRREGIGWFEGWELDFVGFKSLILSREYTRFNAWVLEAVEEPTP